MDAKAALQSLSEPWERGDKIKRAIERSARMAGLSYSRAFEIWYGRARRIEQAELLRISQALEQKNRKDARNELSELRLRLARLENVLLQTDPDFHRPTVDLMRTEMRRSR
jgi:hypothetical protein